jgi:hypothetical protein
MVFEAVPADKGEGKAAKRMWKRLKQWRMMVKRVMD